MTRHHSHSADTKHDLIRMSSESFADFTEVLSRPAIPVPEMMALAKRPAPWEMDDGVKP